jgi:protein CpxP
MTRRFRFVLFAALTAAIVGPSSLYAQGRGVGRGPGFGHGPDAAILMLPLRQLDLTDAQRTQVRQLMERHRSDAFPLVERLRTAADAQRQAMEAAPVDEARIRTAVEQVAQVQADLAVQRARLQSEILSVLTPEQQQRLQQLRAEQKARMQQRRQRLQEPVPQRQPA